MIFRSGITLVLMLCAATWSTACTIPGLRYELAFTDDTHSLQASQIRMVTDWYVDLRDGPFGIDRIYVSAYSIKGNAAHAQLVRARVAAVAELVETLNGADPVPLNSGVSAMESPGPQQYPEILISVQPKCAASHSCCGSDPNLR